MESENVPLLEFEDEVLCIGINKHNDVTVSIDVQPSCEPGDIFHDDERNLIEFNSEGEGETENSTPIILTMGKKYHLFISFSSEDREKVKSIVENLEKKGLRCMYADRDFEQGDEVTNNIVNRLQESMKILLMLTPDFVSSGPCSYEARKAEYIYYLMENRQNCILPVMLVPCEIPVSLKSVTYIDATIGDEATLVDEIVEAFKCDDRYERFLPNNLPFPSKTVNGETIVSMYPRKTSRGLGLEYEELEDYQINDLKEAGLQEAATIYDIMRRELNVIPFMRLDGYEKFCWCCCCFIFLWLLLLAAALALHHKNLSVIIVIFPFAVSILICIGMAKFCCVGNEKKFQSQLNIAWKFAKKYIFKEKILIVKSTSGFDFIKYDTTPCLNTTKNWLKDENPDMSEEELQELAETKLKYAAFRYIFASEFNWWHLPRGIQRHRTSTLQKKACLCELAGVPATNG